MFVYILKREIGYDSKWFCSSSLCFDNFYTKTVSGDKIKYSRIPKNTETQQEKTKENTKKTTEINRDWSKKTSSLGTTEDNVKCHCSLLANFKNGNKNVKTFLKGEQIL